MQQEWPSYCQKLLRTFVVVAAKMAVFVAPEFLARYS
jgi:hypothetical protein